MSIDVSTTLICWNEEEMLPICLGFLETIPHIKEICIADSLSTDSTLDIISSFSSKSKKKYNVISEKFTDFSSHRNKSLAMTTCEYILFIDSDETYSKSLALLFDQIDSSLREYNAFRIGTINMVMDLNHHVPGCALDPHIRIWKHGFASYKNLVHEELTDINGRSLHYSYDSDIYNVDQNFVVKKDNKLLKSVSALEQKGIRWESLGLIEESNKKGIHISKDTWVQWKNYKDYPIEEVPERWR
jgi:glycosyltransferase involved in cell wall biosynthesis